MAKGENLLNWILPNTNLLRASFKQFSLTALIKEIKLKNRALDGAGVNLTNSYSPLKGPREARRRENCKSQCSLMRGRVIATGCFKVASDHALSGDGVQLRVMSYRTVHSESQTCINRVNKKILEKLKLCLDGNPQETLRRNPLR